MKNIGIFGYGSLINLASASRTLQRELVKEDFHVATLHNFQRSWTYWAYVHSALLDKQVKGVFLNIENCKDAKLNGIVFRVDENELEYLKKREKNYDCIDISKDLIFENILSDFDLVFTFIGNPTNIIKNSGDDCYIFKKYINIVETGVNMLGDEFSKFFNTTTTSVFTPLVEGDYFFIDIEQQNSR